MAGWHADDHWSGVPHTQTITWADRGGQYSIGGNSCIRYNIESQDARGFKAFWQSESAATAYAANEYDGTTTYTSALGPPCGTSAAPVTSCEGQGNGLNINSTYYFTIVNTNEGMLWGGYDLTFTVTFWDCDPSNGGASTPPPSTQNDCSKPPAVVPDGAGVEEMPSKLLRLSLSGVALT